jgi:glycosyltransferase involved in cell wall biosynthesis
VDPADYPPVKTAFNREGARRFLYVGHSGFSKNVGYLSEIAALMTDADFGWIGSGRAIPGLIQLGTRDFRLAEAQQLVARYDFLITVGSADANPATILEAMAWGLIPICTRESGYNGYPGIINIPLADAERAVAILRRSLWRPENELRATQSANWESLRSHFNWSRFVDQVADAIESNSRPSLSPISRLRRLHLGFAALTSPYSALSPRNVRLTLGGFGRLKEPDV